jgi:hypothetical protein
LSDLHFFAADFESQNRRTKFRKRKCPALIAIVIIFDFAVGSAIGDSIKFILTGFCQAGTDGRQVRELQSIATCSFQSRFGAGRVIHCSQTVGRRHVRGVQ